MKFYLLLGILLVVVLGVVFLYLTSSVPQQSCHEIYQETGQCPEERCQVCCSRISGNDTSSEGCAPDCCEKPCAEFTAENCPKDLCQVMTDCTGKKVCYDKLGSNPPCGTAGFYGQDVPCCEGLVKRCGMVLANGSCDNAKDYQFPLCLPCGNGICDQLENKCSCPEDCS